MRVAHRQPLAAFLALTLSLVAACDDPNEPPAPGSIEIQVLTSGPDVITNDLRVTIGDTLTRDLNTLEVTVTGLPPGVYPVELEGTSSNCQITGTNPKSVTVESSRTTVVTFTISCTARVGSVRVTTTTTGPDVDADGYTALVIGGPSLSVGINATVTLPNVREGLRFVSLAGVASNCDIVGSDTAAVIVPFGGTVDASFSVQCVGAGSLEVTVSTTGVELDPDGYLVVVDAPSVGYAEDQTIQPNGAVTFPRLLPAADYRVALQQISPNCATVGPSTATVAVTSGATASVAFAIVCEAPARLAIVRDDDIWVIGHDGGGATRLTTEPSREAEPAWSSTGRIAFTTRRHNDDIELYVMNEDGSNAVRLTVSAGADDAPTWSPDGQKLAFRSFRNVNSEIYTINADGSGLARLTNHDAEDVQPAWSSTGKIAFISDRDRPNGELYVMDADGSNVVRLTNNDSTEAHPAWSPDGSRIAFTRQVEPCFYGCRDDIFVINADGSNPRRLATGSAQYLYHTSPAWSPNGRLIAFTRQYCDYYYCHSPEIWVVDPNGGHLAQITDDGADPAWEP